MWRWGKRAVETATPVGRAGPAVPTGRESEKELQCPLCGKKFAAGEAAACSACFLARKCGLVMCPNCSYEFPVG